MDLVSYRGPGAVGGISAGIQQIWNDIHRTGLWWHFEGNTFKCLQSGAREPVSMNLAPDKLVAGHERYCSEFLWPVMHDMPQFARYSEDDRDLFLRFNAMFAQVCQTSDASSTAFVQDYQSAMLPLYLRLESQRKSMLFWHIPWPRNVLRPHIEPLMMIARGMLAAERIGFHTHEYASNFMKFVRDYLPAYAIDEECGFIGLKGECENLRSIEMRRSTGMYSSSYITRPLRRFRDGDLNDCTRIIVCPMGIDVDRWSALAAAAENNKSLFRFSKPYILSVDRADYTKGVRERLRAIDEFFVRHPEKKGKVTFVQLCQQTRRGFREFDRYWQECRALAATTNSRWRSSHWEPLIWIDEPVGIEQLASLYRQADALLVTAVRDGLNLTAKEFIACQGRNPGVLLLSPGAGSWQELSQYSLRIEPGRPDIIAETIAHALSLSRRQRTQRSQEALARLRQKTLEHWWTRFRESQPPEYVTAKERRCVKDAFAIA